MKNFYEKTMKLKADRISKHFYRFQDKKGLICIINFKEVIGFDYVKKFVLIKGGFIEVHERNVLDLTIKTYFNDYLKDVNKNNNTWGK